MNKPKPDKKVLRNTVFALLSEGKTVEIKAGGYSMYPSIKPNDIISIEPIRKEDLHPGEIIAWYRDKDLVCHRLIYIFESEKKTYFLTRGDSSPASDIPLTFTQIAGRITKVQNKQRSFTPPVLSHIPEWRYKFNRTLAWFIRRLSKYWCKIS